MARYLKQSTVVKAFCKRGWVWCEHGGHEYLLFNHLGQAALIGKFNDGIFLKISNGRLNYHPNFHVDSYWGMFRNLKELDAALDTIEKVYRETCGVYFQPR